MQRSSFWVWLAWINDSIGWDFRQRQGHFVPLAKQLLCVSDLLEMRFGFKGVLIPYSSTLLP